MMRVGSKPIYYYRVIVSQNDSDKKDILIVGIDRDGAALCALGD